MQVENKIIDGLEFISIVNNNNFEVVLSPLGASIYAIKKDGVFFTQTPVDISTFKKGNVYHGKSIGRVGNRIEKGDVIINNKHYHVDKNEVNNTLHGGKNGLSNKIFKYNIKESKDKVVIEFHYFYKDLEDGLPGDMDITIRYTVNNDNDEILIEFDTVSNKDTLLALTNHSYYKLSSKNLKDLSLMIKADRFIHPRETDLIPLEIRNVSSIMDFRKSKPILKDIKDKYLVKSRTAGYDHHFYFEKIDTSNPQIELKNKDYKLDIYTDFSGVQIYTDNYPDEDSKWNDVKGKKNRSIAIEPQDTTLNRKITKKDEPYKRFIRLVFKKI